MCPKYMYLPVSQPTPMRLTDELYIELPPDLPIELLIELLLIELLIELPSVIELPIELLIELPIELLIEILIELSSMLLVSAVTGSPIKRHTVSRKSHQCDRRVRVRKGAAERWK